MHLHKCGILPLIFLISVSAHGADEAPGNMKLLAGYSVNHHWAVDAAACTIEKNGGAKIEYEAGPNEGSFADAKDVGQYAWYREQFVNGVKVRFALIKQGFKTGWEPKDSNEEPGNILLITFLLHGEHSSDTADFWVKIRQSSDMADTLLMTMTFDPSKLGCK